MIEPSHNLTILGDKLTHNDLIVYFVNDGQKFVVMLTKTLKFYLISLILLFNSDFRPS